MIKIHLKYVVVVIISIVLASCAKANWDGHYLCEFPVGEVAGGYYAFIDYDLVIDDRICSLSMEGYQSGSKFICTYKENGDHLSVFFKNYAESRFKTNAYKGGELFFELVKNSDGLYTHWKKLYPLSKEPVVDQCFQRQ